MYKQPDPRTPEVELGNSCHIIAVPISNKMDVEKNQTILQLETLAISSSVRKDDKNYWWELFVVGANDITVIIWEKVRAYFGEFKYFEKVC